MNCLFSGAIVCIGGAQKRAGGVASAKYSVVKKWTQRYRNWDQVLNQLIVLYGERLTNYL